MENISWDLGQLRSSYCSAKPPSSTASTQHRNSTTVKEVVQIRSSPEKIRPLSLGRKPSVSRRALLCTRQKRELRGKKKNPTKHGREEKGEGAFELFHSLFFLYSGWWNFSLIPWLSISALNVLPGKPGSPASRCSPPPLPPQITLGGTRRAPAAAGRARAAQRLVSWQLISVELYSQSPATCFIHAIRYFSSGSGHKAIKMSHHISVTNTTTSPCFFTLHCFRDY